MHKVAILLRVVVCICVLLPLFFWLVNGAAFRQRSDEVAIRKPGDRFLGKPKPAQSEAQRHLEYAWMSEYVYGPEWLAKQNVKDSSGCQAPGTALENAGWTPLEGVIDEPTQNDLDSRHLRVNFWRNTNKKMIAVAFGGTDPSSKYDWISNFRWFLKSKNDEYTMTSGLVAGKFSDKIASLRNGPESEFFKTATINVTGHSLGAGLAQQFAYALPIGGPKVTEVYAFDPSPVTGYSGVNPTTSSFNVTGLKIDRIYERGEILAILRSLTNLVDPPRSVNPEIRQVRYNLFWNINPVAGHSIASLACQLDRTAYPKPK